MKIRHMSAIAQEVIDAVSSLVAGRTINIMDTDGIIIASSDSSRIGSFHQGAAEAVLKRGDVHISPEELPLYPGAKEGINMPIIKDDQILGVVGIYGDPSEVSEAAHLLRVYVGMALEMATSNKNNQFKKELRLRLLQQMVLSDDMNRDELISQAQEISVDIKLPVRVVAITVTGSKTSKLPHISALDRLEGLLISKRLIELNKDIYGVLDDRLIILKFTGGGFNTREFLDKLLEAAGPESSYQIEATIGGNCSDWGHLPASYREALFLCRVNNRSCCDLEDNSTKAEYLMSNIKSGPVDRFITPMYDSLAEGFGSREINWIMETIQTYCDSDFSASLASEKLFIHKNTLIYRINKVLSLMGLENEQSYIKEFFLKMLLIYHHRQ